MNKEEQKKLLTEIMEADEKDGLYKTNNMAQQTAVEWLENELKKIPFINPKEAFEQAKQMEKEQIVKTYNDAINKMDYFIQPESAEQYYNETYQNK